MNYYDEFKHICENVYDFAVDTGYYLLFGIGLSCLEAVMPFMLISIIYKRDAARAFVQGMRVASQQTAFTSQMYWDEGNLLLKVLINITKIRLLVGGLLWFLGFVSLTNALLIVLSALLTTIWVSAICLIGVLLETRQEPAIDVMRDFIRMNELRPPAMAPPFANVRHIEEPMLGVNMHPNEFEGIDYIEWTNGEHVWAINGDRRHLIRQANLDRLLATPLPRNPYTQDPIVMVQRAVINILDAAVAAAPAEDAVTEGADAPTPEAPLANMLQNE